MVSDGVSLLLMKPTEIQDGSIISECFVDNKLLNFDFFIDNSWVKYDRGQYISSIDEDKSYFNLESQTLIHHEYNKDGGFNFIPLKNNLTYKGNTVRGSYSDNDVDFREYNNIHVGTTGEKGNENIVLSFRFNEQEFEVNDGDDLVFTVDEEGWNKVNQININNTKFIKNGSFGSNVPFFADKVKKLGKNSIRFDLDYILQEGYEPTTDDRDIYFLTETDPNRFILEDSVCDDFILQEGYKPYVTDRDVFFLTEKTNQRFILEQSNTIEQSTTNNGTYLCSWLYKENHDSEPVWVDRYYYPDIVKRENLLTEEIYKQSFNNIIDDAYSDKPQIKNDIYQNSYYDKKSDLYLKPKNIYRYQRVSTETVNEVIDKMKEKSIIEIEDNKHKSCLLSDYFAFDNENYKVIKYDKWNKTNVINLNMDMYLRRDKRIGIQLFGSDFKHGFNIQNRKDLVPFHYYATDETVYLCNNKFESVHEFNLYEKYGDKILKLILGDTFDDVIIISGMWMYILSYDLMLKSRIDLTATKTEVGAIKDIEKNLSVGLSPILDGQIKFDGNDVFGAYENGEVPSISLVNYPYNHTKIEIDEVVTCSDVLYLDETVSGTVSLN